MSVRTWVKEEQRVKIRFRVVAPSSGRYERKNLRKSTKKGYAQPILKNGE